MIRVQSEGYALNVRVSGPENGPVLLLSNSLGTTVEMWAPQRAALEQTHRVIGYDTRGHGASGSPDGPYDFDGLVGDALAVLDHFGVDQAAMMGLSIGGMTGLGVALAAPDRLSQLICACARADNPPPFVQNWDNRLAIIAKEGVPALWPMTETMWLTEDFRAENPETMTRLEQEFLRTTDAGYAGCAEALKGLSYLEKLGDIRVPTLFVAGEQDMGAPVATMEEMAEATPGARLVVIPDSGHIANINQPEAFTAAVQEFLG